MNNPVNELNRFYAEDKELPNGDRTVRDGAEGGKWVGNVSAYYIAYALQKLNTRAESPPVADGELIKFMENLHEQEDEMQQTISDDVKPGDTDHDCYKTHEYNKMMMERVINALQRQDGVSD